MLTDKVMVATCLYYFNQYEDKNNSTFKTKENHEIQSKR